MVFVILFVWAIHTSPETEVTNTEFPESVATATEVPKEVETVPELSVCPVTAKKAIPKPFAWHVCHVLTMKVAPKLSACPLTAMEAISKHSVCYVMTMEVIPKFCYSNKDSF